MFLRRTWSVLKRHRWKLLVGGGAAAAAAGMAYIGNLVYVHYKYLSEIVNDTDELDRLLAELLGVNPEDIKEAIQKEEEEKRKQGVLVEEGDGTKTGKNDKEKREDEREEEEEAHDHGGSLTSRVTSFFSSFFGNGRKEEEDKKGGSYKTRNMIGRQEEERGEIDDILKRIAQSIEWKRTLQFLKVQEVCDKTLWSVRTPLHQVICDSFFVDQYTAILRDPASVRKLSPARKRRCFFEMSVEVFARTLTSLYLFILLAVVHRIEINLIVGHQLREEDETHRRRQNVSPSSPDAGAAKEEEEEQRRRRRSCSGDENRDDEKIVESSLEDSFKNEVHHSTRSSVSPSTSSSSVFSREPKASPGYPHQDSSFLSNCGGSSSPVVDLSCKETREKANYVFLTSCRYLLRSADSLVMIVDTFLEVTEDYLSHIQPEEVVSSHQLFHLLLEVISKAHALILHQAERRARDHHTKRRRQVRKQGRKRKEDRSTTQALREGEVKSERSERDGREEEREEDRENGDIVPQGLAALLLPMDESILDIRRVMFRRERYEDAIGGEEEEEKEEEEMASTGGRFLSKRYRRKSIWERTMKEIAQELSSLTGEVSHRGIKADDEARRFPSSSSSSFMPTSFSENKRSQRHSEEEEGEGTLVSSGIPREEEKGRWKTTSGSQSSPLLNTPSTFPFLQSSPSTVDGEEEEEDQNSSSSNFRRHLLHLLLNETQDVLESPIASSAVEEALTAGISVLIERLQFSLLQNGLATISPPLHSSSSPGVSTSASSLHTPQNAKISSSSFSSSSSTDRSAVASSDAPRPRKDDSPTSPSDEAQTRWTSARGRIQRGELPGEQSAGTSHQLLHVSDSSPFLPQRSDSVEEKSLSHPCFFPFARCFGRFCQLGDWIVLGDQSGLLLSSTSSRTNKEEKEDTHKREKGLGRREGEEEEQEEEGRDDVYKDSELMVVLSNLPQLEQLSSLLFFPIDSAREAARVEAFLTIAKEEKLRTKFSSREKTRAILSTPTPSRSCHSGKNKSGEEGKRSDSSRLLSGVAERGEGEGGRIGRKEEDEEKKRQSGGVWKEEEMTERRRDEDSRGVKEEGEEGVMKKQIEKPSPLSTGAYRSDKERNETFPDKAREREEREKMKNVSSFFSTSSSSCVYISGEGEETRKEKRLLSSTTTVETKVAEEEEELRGGVREVQSERFSSIHHASNREAPHKVADSSVFPSSRDREKTLRIGRQQDANPSVEKGSAAFSQSTTNRNEEEEDEEKKRRETHQLSGDKPKQEEKEVVEEKDITVETMIVVKKKTTNSDASREEGLVVRENASPGLNGEHEEMNFDHEDQERNTSFLSKMNVDEPKQMIGTEEKEEEEDEDEGFLDCEVSSFSSSSPVSSSTPPDIHSLLLPGASSRRLSSLDGWADVPAVHDLSSSLATYNREDEREDDEQERGKEKDRSAEEKKMEASNDRDFDRTIKEGGEGGEEDKGPQEKEGETKREKEEEEKERKEDKMR